MSVIMDWFKRWQAEQPSVSETVTAAPGTGTTVNLSPGPGPRRETGPYSWQFPSAGPPSVTLPKGTQGESVWETLTPEDKKISEPLPPPKDPVAAVGDLGTNVLKQVTRIAVIIIVGLIGIIALLQIMPPVPNLQPPFRRRR